MFADTKVQSIERPHTTSVPLPAVTHNAQDTAPRLATGGEAKHILSHKQVAVGQIQRHACRAAR